jgi:chromate transporter
MWDSIELLIDLFITFAKLALFNFGGGFVMISLIQGEILANDWLSLQEFNNVIAISQMTPGAIAINTATYVGYKIAGVMGAIVTSLAIPIPSFFIVLILSPILLKYKDHGINKMIFYGIRPIVVALIINAAVTVAKTPFFIDSALSIARLINWNTHLKPFNLGSIGISLMSLYLIVKVKLNPIVVIFIAALLGMVLFSF